MERPRRKEDQQRWHNRSTHLPHLRNLRKNKGMTQRDLATRAGVSSSTILLLEQGKRGAYALTVRKLAAALGVSTAGLVRGRLQN